MKKNQMISSKDVRHFPKCRTSEMLALSVMLFLISSAAFSQSLSVFDVDTTNFPTIKAKFFAFDSNGNQLTNLNVSDFEVKENGVERNVTDVSCPVTKLQALSSVLVMDASGSMSGGNLNLAKEAAKAWIEAIPLGISECAITAFDTKNFLIQDFTTNKTKLFNGVNSLFAGGGTSYDAALLDPLAGGLLVTKNGKFKKVIVFLSDGMPNYEPKTSQIISEASKQNLTIYCVTLNMRCPQNMKNMSNSTGGLWFENVTTVEQARQIYQQILQTAQGGNPCEIEWQSGVSCVSGITNVDLRIMNLGLTAVTSYQSPNASVSKLEFNPTSLKFENHLPGVTTPPQTVTVTARNADFTINNITTQIPVGFEITPKNFPISLKAGQSMDFTVIYFPADSGYNYCRFDIDCVPCPTRFYVSGGWKGKKPTIRTIKLLHPNGGEVFVAGSDIEITWEGVSPDEPVTIKYSTDNGSTWEQIAEKVTGLSYQWRVPKTPSNQCLAMVIAAAKTSFYCDDVEICGKLWMGCNLDVETYRNGDPIPEVIDSTQWSNLTTGAWCYYDNDPANGEIYGKLYNWYAVNDPRGLAPEGWHVPTDEEWTELENCLISNGYNYDGTTTGNKIAKSLATASGWASSTAVGSVGNTDYPLKRNSTGFSAFPGGYRYYNGTFLSIGLSCYWWSATEFNAATAWYRRLRYCYTSIYRTSINKENGLSIRCVRD